MASTCTLAVVGTRGLAAELGKKGTASDITLYNQVHDEHALTLVEPTAFPEKFAALLFALAMADEVYVVVGELNREVAETLATVDLFSKPTRLLLGAGVGEGDVRRILAGLELAKAPIGPLDVLELRSDIERLSAPAREGPVRVPLDHAFPVKGVGAVALGVVRQGILRAHDELELAPTGRSVEVRSIQVHDIDVKEATTGQRVGVALRGVDSGELDRGQTLAAPGSLASGNRLELRDVRRSPYYKGDLASGGQANVLVGLQFVPAKVDRPERDMVSVTTDRPVAYAASDHVFVTDLSVPSGPRLAWRGTL
jgi:selenocysteine-specific translation elongation factor